MVRAVVFGSFERRIVAAGFFVKLQTPCSVVNAYPPPARRLDTTGQFRPENLSIDEVIDRIGKNHVRGRCKFHEGSSRFNRTLPVIYIIGGCQVERDSLVWLNAVT